ncbi:MAG: hypothetical protein NXI20_15315 [bacterium]|nr:hypothetical protein [bacterium]
MKKFVLTLMIAMGFSVASQANERNEEKVDSYDWLIEEIYGLENEKQDLEVLKEMVYLYDADGNEIVKFEAGQYDNLDTETKRKIQMSEFMFETLGDQVYMMQ